ncbi:signal transduction histidine kinase [Brachyspira hampsonii]|uniref:Histidine kinase n=1 Tax=Brachyspira hampsonii TaxID=1287055 RepID=A0AAC9TV71_9SPIR|nr:signal transduction histidine kinase [Brachyspira hampsonii]ASJ21429.1 histidine kinase [Brachyspira hampsonii]ELV06206.1 Signal transduction histidine kinase [Brachyspira hampsonii 30599]OEJ19686.1 histidine kinase [Brachyspira hampsonii]
MKQNFYINSKLKDLISNIIYDVQNYNNIISKYIDIERCANNYCSESRATIVRQSILINRTMEALNDFNDINSDSFKLNMNFENISVIINEALDDIFLLFKSKRTKITLNDKIFKECIVLMDRDKIKRSILNIFTFIYNIIKVNTSINITYNLMNYYDDKEFLLINGVDNISKKDEKTLDLNEECIDISITFESDDIPDDIKRMLFKTPLISYDNFSFNNLYLYTAYRIIKEHYGNIWFESVKNEQRINIIFPAKNKL